MTGFTGFVHGASHLRSRRIARSATIASLRDTCSVDEDLLPAVLACSMLEEVEQFNLFDRVFDRNLDRKLGRPTRDSVRQ